MSRIDQLRKNYQRICGLPWDRNIAGAQRVWLAVYDKEDERKLRFRLGIFKEATEQTGHHWHAVDFTNAFADWLCSPPYADFAESYFESPTRFGIAPMAAFKKTVAAQLTQTLQTVHARRRHGGRRLRRGFAVWFPPHFRNPAPVRNRHPGQALGLLSRGLRTKQLPPARRTRWLELPRSPDHCQ